MVSCPSRDAGGTLTHLDGLPVLFLQLPDPPAPSSQPQPQASQLVAARTGTAVSDRRAAMNELRGPGYLHVASWLFIYVQPVVGPALPVKKSLPLSTQLCLSNHSP